MGRQGVGPVLGPTVAAGRLVVPAEMNCADHQRGGVQGRVIRDNLVFEQSWLESLTQPPAGWRFEMEPVEQLISSVAVTQEHL